MPAPSPSPAGATGERSGRRWIARLLLMVGTTVVALALAEAWARWSYRPVLQLGGEFIGTQTYPDQRNANGFREGELTDAIMSARTRRLLILGDSFTFGSGVPDPSQRFTDRLERELGAGFHVYNAGIPGSRPSDWARVARAFLGRYRPETVVAVFFLRDGTGLSTSLHFHTNKIAEIKARHCDGSLYAASYLVRKVLDRRVLNEFSTWYLGEFRSSYLGSDLEQRIWTAMKKELLDLRDLCAEADASFHLVVFPLLFSLADYRFHDVEAEILGFAERNGIPSTSLISGFEGHDERELWVSPVDQHPNPEGHRIAADTLLAYLRAVL